MTENLVLENTFKGKLASTSDKFKSYFLLLFTKELIRHSTETFFKIEHEVKKRDELSKKEKHLEKIPAKLIPIKKSEKTKETNKDPFFLSLMHRFPQKTSLRDSLEPPKKQIFNIEAPLPKPVIIPNTQPPMPKPISQRIPQRRNLPLVIPNQPLPPELQYIQPYPTDIQVDLGKLNPLSQDPNVKIIECNGPDEQIMVKGTMGTKPTNTLLNKEEIEILLQGFFQQAKIPYHEGVHKVVLGQFILSAIISEVVGSKFIIRKMPPMTSAYPITQPDYQPLPFRMPQRRYF